MKRISVFLADYVYDILFEKVGRGKLSPYLTRLILQDKEGKSNTNTQRVATEAKLAEKPMDMEADVERPSGTATHEQEVVKGKEEHKLFKIIEPPGFAPPAGCPGFSYCNLVKMPCERCEWQQPCYEMRTKRNFARQ